MGFSRAVWHLNAAISPEFKAQELVILHKEPLNPEPLNPERI
jgi:hypothetical protein